MKRRKSKHRRKTKKAQLRSEANSSSTSSSDNTSSCDQNALLVGGKLFDFFERTKQDSIVAETKQVLLQGSKFVSHVLKNIPGINDVSSDDTTEIEDLLPEPSPKKENRDDIILCDDNDLNVRDDASPKKTRYAKIKTASGGSLLSSATKKRLKKKRTVPIQIYHQQNRIPTIKNANNEATTKDEKSHIDLENNDVTKTASTMSLDGEKKELESRSVISAQEVSDKYDTPHLLPDINECEQKETTKGISTDEIEVTVSHNPSEVIIIMASDEREVYSIVGCASDRITASTENVKKEDIVYEDNQLTSLIAKSTTFPEVSTDIIISSSFNKYCPLGPGKMYHYLEQLRMEAIYADKTIQTLQVKLEKLKKSNDIFEARGKEFKQFTSERKHLIDLKEKNKELQLQNSKITKKYNEVHTENKILHSKINLLLLLFFLTALLLLCWWGNGMLATDFPSISFDGSGFVVLVVISLFILLHGWQLFICVFASCFIIDAKSDTYCYKELNLV